VDARRFDVLTRTLSSPDTRRRLLAALATTPLLGGLVTLLDPEDAEGKKRRRRRKDRHRRRKGKADGKRRRKQHRRACKPKKREVVCAGKCGTVKSRQTCGKTVDCGSCDCDPPCGECFTCQGNGDAPGTCVSQAGAPCGPGQTCENGVLQPQGSCDGSGACQAAEPVSCSPYVDCADATTCASSCQDDADCVAEAHCQGGVCVGDLPDGGTCANDGQCASGYCVDDVCCVAASCDTCQVCNASGDGTCSVVPDGTACGSGDVCCGGTCQECCDNDQCASPTPYCADGTCSSTCTAHAQCGANAICVDGVCEACNVTCPSDNAQTCGTALQAALDGDKDTLYVCPGKYVGGFTIGRTVEVIGAGQGGNPASNTVLDGNETQRVMHVAAGDVTLRYLRLANGSGESADSGPFGGGGVFSQTASSLTMLDCTVIKNAGGPGGGISYYGSSLTLTRCTLRENYTTSGGAGGGLVLAASSPSGTFTLTDCVIEDNSASSAFGGGIAVYSGQLTLAGATRIALNRTRYNGGGIRVYFSSSTNVTIGEDCRITGNISTEGAGGGIYKDDDLTTVTLQGADPSSIVINNCPDNCGGEAVEKCAITPVYCPPS
jgi:hypothetical protein